jgi:tetratricopeptide (TPR) repeat protein
MTGIHRGNGGLNRFGALRTAAALVSLAGAAWAGAGSAAAPNSAAVQRNLARLQTLAVASDRGDCATVLRDGVPLMDAAGGTGLPDEAEAIGYDIVALCEEGSGKGEAAYAHALRGTKLEHSSDTLWHLRLFHEMHDDRAEAAVATIEAMSQGRGAALNSAPLPWMGQIDRALKEPGKEAVRRRFLKVLGSDSYAPDDAFGSNDWFRIPYAVLLAGEGNGEGARAVLSKLKTPTGLAEASLDPRLRAVMPPAVDMRAAAEAELASHKDAMQLHPDRLAAVVQAAGDLRQLGRDQESVTLLNSVAAKLNDPEAFSDRDEQMSWWWDSLGRAYTTLGRYDEALSAFQKGGSQKEGGSLNFSQLINLAAMQNDFGRGEEALKTLKAFDDPARKGSPYGVMQIHIVRACGFATAGRPAEAAADLAFIKAHDKDDPAALGDTLLCLGDMDGAAAAFIARLDDPDRRAAALRTLSDFDAPPASKPIGVGSKRLPALKQRPDVKAAIARAGGVRRFNIQEDGL